MHHDVEETNGHHRSHSLRRNAKDCKGYVRARQTVYGPGLGDPDRAATPNDFGSRLQELEDRLTAVTDERWAGALRLALVRVAWDAGHVEAAQHALTVLEGLWPFMD